MQLAASLVKVEFCVSTTCYDPTQSGAWLTLRDFGRWGCFLHSFGDRLLQTELLPGDNALQIGARRILHIGSGKLVEQLTAIDQDNKTLQYKLISHPANVNPFDASFVNYTCHISTRTITMTNQSFVEMSGSFMTEPAAAEAMHFSLVCFHETYLRGLSHFLSHKPSLDSAYSMPAIGSSGKRMGSFELPRGSMSPIGRTSSAHHDYFLSADRQNSSDSTRSHVDGHGQSTH